MQMQIQLQKTVKILSVIALIFSVMAAGCGGGKNKGNPVINEPPIDEPVDPPDDPIDPDPVPTAVMDSALLLGAGEAWIDLYPAGYRDGFVFMADGSFIAINDYADEVTFYISDTGSVTTSGDTLTVTSGWLYFSLEYGASAPYAVSGDTLRLSVALDKSADLPVIAEGVFVRRQGVVPTPSPPAVAKSRIRPAWKM